VEIMLKKARQEEPPNDQAEQKSRKGIFKRLIKRLSLKVILILSFAVFILVSVSIVYGITYAVYRNMFSKLLNNFSVETLINKSNLLDMNLKQYDQLSTDIIASPSNLSIMSIKEDDSYENAVAWDEFSKNSSAIAIQLQTSYLLNITLRSKYNAYRAYMSGSYVGSAANDTNIDKYDNALYREIAGNDGRITFLDTDNYQFSRGITDNCFAVGRLVKQYDGAELGYIIIFIKSQIFDDVLNITPSDENSSLYIVSQDGAMIYSHQNSAKALSVLNENYANLPAGRNSEVISEKGSSYLITYYTSAYSGWTMVNITPISYLLNGFVVNRNLTFLFCLLFILIAVIVAIYISGSITEPVKQIMLAMRGVSSGNMSLRIRTSGGREIKELGDHFNSMIEKIGLLMEENNAKQRGIAKAEISMLQAQINPHFLYNTLNSIRWLCIFNKQDQIKNMIDNLSRLIMHTYKESDALIPLSDEVIILNCYVNLMKVRYTNFDFNIVGIEDFLQFKVLKFTIQPFIENAIIHGFNGLD
jgi:two-component system sensor histidine kinase YesM